MNDKKDEPAASAESGETESDSRQFAPESSAPVRELDLGDYSETMVVGEKQLIVVTVIPKNAGYNEIKFESTDSSVASINGLGRIEALKEGKTDITVSCGGVQETFTLTVEDRKIESETEETAQTVETGKSDTGTYQDGDNGNTGGNVNVKAVEISDHEDRLAVGSTIILSANIVPSDAADTSISFKSSSDSIATVNSSGEVKGISKGKVTIYATAGDVTAKTYLNVYVKTSEIRVDKDYLVLKENQNFKLNAKAFPEDAEQVFTYKTSDKNVANVDDSGRVAAVAPGNTSIIVSNGDMTISVSVIVGSGNTEKNEGTFTEGAKIKNNSQNYDTVIDADEYPLISSEMLNYYYCNKSQVKINGRGYSILIDGNSIVNCNNELRTDIDLSVDESGMTFVINNEKDICGPITLCIDNAEGKFLYLWNESKERYENLETGDPGGLKITSPGRYMLTIRKIRAAGWHVFQTLTTAAIVLAGGIGIYIFKNKKYWFW